MAEELRTSLRALIRVQPAESPSVKVIHRRFGLNRATCHRLARALGPVDPLATLNHIPGPEPLRRLVDAARDTGVPADVLQRAAAAVEAFDDLITHLSGDRSGLDAIISDSLPEARRRYESEAKQLVYRGMRQIKGICADVVLCTTLLYPSRDDHRRLDLVCIRGFFGLRCVRPGSRLALKVESGTQNALTAACSLDGQPLRSHPRGAILERFSTDPDTTIDVSEFGSNLTYALDWRDSVGLPSARNVVMVEVIRNGPRRVRTPDDTKRFSGLIDDINVPTEVYVNDLLLHKDAYPNWEPRMRVLETGQRGWAAANDQTRDLDVLNVQETLMPLGSDWTRLAIRGVPNYIDILGYVLGRVGETESPLRCFRTHIEYPVFSSQVQCRFDVPVETGSEVTRA